MKRIFTILLLVISFSSLRSQEFDVFERVIFVDNKDVHVHFFLPQGYDESNEYPLIMAMSPGGGPGILIRDMLMMFASENNVILACPDSKILDTLYYYCLEEFSVDQSKVLVAGYSAGGGATFPWGVDNPDKIRGAIGIAPSVGYVNYIFTINRAFGLIAGTADGAHSACTTMKDNIEKYGGKCKFISKEGVQHIDGYYGSPEFNEDFTECYNFIMDYDPGEQPELLLPADNSEDPGDPVVFTWDEMPQAENYTIRVFYSNYILIEEIVEETSFTTELDGNSTYFWSVKANGDDYQSAWADVRTFSTPMSMPKTAPEILMPADSADNISPKSYLRWDQMPTAEVFHVQVSDDEFETLVIDDSTFAYIMYDHVDYPWVHEVTYWWRVRAGNEYGWGPWSRVYTFTCFDYYASVEDNNKNDVGIMTFPNPAQDKIYFNFVLEQSTKTKVTLYDMFGNPVESTETNHFSPGRHSIRLDTENLESGIYFYKIIINAKLYSGKVIVNK